MTGYSPKERGVFLPNNEVSACAVLIGAAVAVSLVAAVALGAVLKARKQVRAAKYARFDDESAPAEEPRAEGTPAAPPTQRASRLVSHSRAPDNVRMLQETVQARFARSVALTSAAIDSQLANEFRVVPGSGAGRASSTALRSSLADASYPLPQHTRPRRKSSAAPARGSVQDAALVAGQSRPQAKFPMTRALKTTPSATSRLQAAATGAVHLSMSVDAGAGCHPGNEHVAGSVNLDSSCRT